MQKYFCPQCEMMTTKSDKIICENCKKEITPIRLQHEDEWYYEEAKKTLDESHRDNILFYLSIAVDIMTDEIKAYLAENGGEYKEYKVHIKTNQEIEAKKNPHNIPKCPVCQSTNIEKISAGKRALHGYAFGLFSKTGLYVPCEAAEISPVDYIFTHFPREEESGINSSRFTVEIKELKRICDNMTDKSLVILNESLQSTTPAECLEIAKIHLEILAAAEVKGLFVTHLTGLYDEISKINAKCYRTKLSSIVSTVDSESGERLYKMLNGKPPKVSMAYDIYNKFGAKLSDVAKGDG